MKTTGASLLAVSLATLALGACDGPETDPVAAPETGATMAEGGNEALVVVEPSVGAPPPEGGGVPGSSETVRPMDSGGSAEDTPLPPDPAPDA